MNQTRSYSRILNSDMRVSIMSINPMWSTYNNVSMVLFTVPLSVGTVALIFSTWDDRVLLRLWCSIRLYLTGEQHCEKIDETSAAESVNSEWLWPARPVFFLYRRPFCAHGLRKKKLERQKSIRLKGRNWEPILQTFWRLPDCCSLRSPPALTAWTWPEASAATSRFSPPRAENMKSSCS